MLVDVSAFADVDQFNDFRVLIEPGVGMSNQLAPTAAKSIGPEVLVLFWEYKDFVLAEQLIDGLNPNLISIVRTSSPSRSPLKAPRFGG
ncbi:MAG: hypothetical protein CM1200mP9_10930 [Gammaproteobacteria bacterium]|nr:MAG: hypothetical protein CM1200mP9_10930 [Gammaproteobacteria bacterium]